MLKPDESPEISILIVSYNTRDLTTACIESVFAFSPPGGQEVIVVDNASTDGSADAVAERFPQARLVRSTENLGFGKANNLAAQSAKGRYILLLNPDTIVLDDAITKLVDFAKANPAAGMWGGRTLFPDLTLAPESCWRFMSPWSLFAAAVGLSAFFPKSNFFNREAYAGWNRDSVRRVDIIVGCFCLIERGLWDRLGGFDSRFFMYAEEADLCYRAVKLGATPLFTPDASIIHFEGASENIRADKIIRLYRGKSTYIRKHWPLLKTAIGIGLLKLNSLLRAFAYRSSAIIRRNPVHRLTGAEWQRVWRERSAWGKGYPPVTE